MYIIGNLVCIKMYAKKTSLQTKNDSELSSVKHVLIYLNLKLF